MTEPATIQKRGRWSHTTPFLFYACLVPAMGDLIYGYDVGLFGNLQALPSFLNRFGTNIGGKQKLTSHTTAIANSIIFLGKGVGVLAFEPVVSRFGFKWTLFSLGFAQILGAIIELTSHNWQGFIAGRVITYFAVGFCETAAPTYTSELAPAPVRAFFSGSIAFWLGAGVLWGSLMSRPFVDTQENYGWRVPVGISMVPAAIMIFLLWWAPESPRWLIAHGQKAKALAILDRIRPQVDVDSGHTILEMEAIEQAIIESQGKREGSWLDLFRGNYFRRTMIASWNYILQQISGNAFLASYSTVFYKTLGYGNQSFNYTIAGSAANLAITIPCLFLYDKLGRRPIMIVGSFFMIPGLFIVAALGSKAVPGPHDIGAIVFSVILYGCAVKVAFSTACYTMAAEVGGVNMRQKIMSFAAACDVLSAFVNNYSVPYLLNSPGANLKAKVGYIFGSICICSFLYCVFFVPELKNRSLEEVDELFARKLWAWQFDKIETHGAGARIAALQGSRTMDLQAKNDKNLEAVAHVERETEATLVWTPESTRRGERSAALAKEKPEVLKEMLRFWDTYVSESGTVFGDPIPWDQKQSFPDAYNPDKKRTIYDDYFGGDHIEDVKAWMRLGKGQRFSDL